jgi:hypothetical protein
MLKKTFNSIILLFFVFQSNAQFFDGFGVFMGGTSSRHRYVNNSSYDAVFLTHIIPAPTHKSKELFYFSIGTFKEFLSYKHFKWQTEFEYCRKGAVEKIVNNMPSTETTGKNQYTNIEWNNFIKLIQLIIKFLIWYRKLWQRQILELDMNLLIMEIGDCFQKGIITPI